MNNNQHNNQYFQKKVSDNYDQFGFAKETSNDMEQQLDNDDDDQIDDGMIVQPCRFCTQKNAMQRLFYEMLQSKYFEAFNFYFAKPINEILANISMPHVILYKDILYNDTENEYLKRYYQSHEQGSRIQGLCEFYLNYKPVQPNLCIVDQSKVLNKRNSRHIKLQQKLQDKMENNNTQNNQHDGNNQNENEDQQQQSTSEQLDQQEAQKETNKNDVKNFNKNKQNNNFLVNNNLQLVSILDENNNIMNSDSKSHQINKMYHSRELDIDALNEEMTKQQRANKEDNFIQDLEKQEREVSFESIKHDIYNPVYNEESQANLNNNYTNGSNNILQMQNGDEKNKFNAKVQEQFQLLQPVVCQNTQQQNRLQQQQQILMRQIQSKKGPQQSTSQLGHSQVMLNYQRFSLPDDNYIQYDQNLKNLHPTLMKPYQQQAAIQSQVQPSALQVIPNNNVNVNVNANLPIYQQETSTKMISQNQKELENLQQTLLNFQIQYQKIDNQNTIPNNANNSMLRGISPENYQKSNLTDRAHYQPQQLVNASQQIVVPMEDKQNANNNTYLIKKQTPLQHHYTSQGSIPAANSHPPNPSAKNKFQQIKELKRMSSQAAHNYLRQPKTNKQQRFSQIACSVSNQSAQIQQKALTSRPHYTAQPMHHHHVHQKLKQQQQPTVYTTINTQKTNSSSSQIIFKKTERSMHMLNPAQTQQQQMIKQTSQPTEANSSQVIHQQQISQLQVQGGQGTILSQTHKENLKALIKKYQHKIENDTSPLKQQPQQIQIQIHTQLPQNQINMQPNAQQKMHSEKKPHIAPLNLKQVETVKIQEEERQKMQQTKLSQIIQQQMDIGTNGILQKNQHIQISPKNSNKLAEAQNVMSSDPTRQKRLCEPKENPDPNNNPLNQQQQDQYQYEMMKDDDQYGFWTSRSSQHVEDYRKYAKNLQPQPQQQQPQPTQIHENQAIAKKQINGASQKLKMNIINKASNSQIRLQKQPPITQTSKQTSASQQTNESAASNSNSNIVVSKKVAQKQFQTQMNKYNTLNNQQVNKQNNYQQTINKQTINKQNINKQNINKQISHDQQQFSSESSVNIYKQALVNKKIQEQLHKNVQQLSGDNLRTVQNAHSSKQQMQYNNYFLVDNFDPASAAISQQQNSAHHIQNSLIKQPLLNNNVQQVHTHRQSSNTQQSQHFSMNQQELSHNSSSTYNQYFKSGGQGGAPIEKSHITNKQISTNSSANMSNLQQQVNMQQQAKEGMKSARDKDYRNQMLMPLSQYKYSQNQKQY